MGFGKFILNLLFLDIKSIHSFIQHIWYIYKRPRVRQRKIINEVKFLSPRNTVTFLKCAVRLMLLTYSDLTKWRIRETTFSL